MRVSLSRFWLQTSVASLLLLAGCAGVSADPAVAPQKGDTVLRRVADGILAASTRRLIDHNTGETFTDSAALEARPSVTIESEFNAWYYQTWLLADGMRRVAESLDEPRYPNYGEENLEFLYRHLPYLKNNMPQG